MMELEDGEKDQKNIDTTEDKANKKAIHYDYDSNEYLLSDYESGGDLYSYINLYCCFIIVLEDQSNLQRILQQTVILSCYALNLYYSDIIYFII